MQIIVTTGDAKTMKKCVAAMFVMVLLSCPQMAQCLGTDMYVVDIAALNVRADGNDKAKVVGNVTAGQKVQAFASASGWTRIATDEGLSGWVSTRYLSVIPPSEKAKMPDLPEPGTLKEKYEAAALENQTLKEENISLTTRLNEQTIQMGAMEDAFQSLKRDADAYHQLKGTLVLRDQELKEKTEKIAILEKKIVKQYTDMAVKWSLVGAGILLTGFLLGARNKKKRSSLI